MLIPVILSGGAGTRLWPLSRELYPKQLLSLITQRTMLQDTITRLDGLADVAPPIVVCNEAHRFMVAEQLHAIDHVPQAIILEPVGRNTAPAVALAALTVEKGSDPGPHPSPLPPRRGRGSDAQASASPLPLPLAGEGAAILLVLPADHVIDDLAKFHQAVKLARKEAEAGHLVTFGVVARTPETGYGYIRRKNGAGPTYAVGEFVEKPDLARAERYVTSGDYYWNSGMFMFKASRYLEELKRLAPDILETCTKALAAATRDLDFTRLPEAEFSKVRSDSIDYAVMEKTANAVVVPLDAGWSDVGSWASLREASHPDPSGNVVRGDVIVEDSHNSLLYAGSRLVAAVGLEGHVVVETKDAVLVAPMSRAQDVKNLVNRLQTKERPERSLHREVFRPWGSYDGIDAGDRFQVKRLTVKPGAEMSLQMHHHRAEHWVVVSGTARITRGEETFLLEENQSTYIPIGTKHRIANPGKVPLRIIEVQTGGYLGEDDIVRYEDKYGRQGTSK